MKTQIDVSDVRAADESFFSALVTGDVNALRELLTDDFVLISVMDGAPVAKEDLIMAVASGSLKFDTIDPAGDPTVRLYGPAAVVSNQTRMSGEFQGQSWTVNSRYAHVFVRQDRAWRMASAQGTRLPER